MGRIACGKCNKSERVDIYTVCKTCNGVDFHREINPIAFLSEGQLDALLMLLQDGKSISNVSKEHLELFVMALKAKINNYNV